jgi:hypothetical protein
MSETDGKVISVNNASDEEPRSLENDIEGTVLGFDPAFERRTLRKFDKWLLPPLAIILLIAYLDRSNLGMFQMCGCHPRA